MPGIGAFGFDHHQRDAVDVTHDIGRARMRAVGGEHLAFFGDVPQVVGCIAPVDHRDGGLVLLAVGHELGDGDAQRQQVIQPLIGSQ